MNGVVEFAYTVAIAHRRAGYGGIDETLELGLTLGGRSAFTRRRWWRRTNRFACTGCGRGAPLGSYRAHGVEVGEFLVPVVSIDEI